jgi:hypothetical protein
MTETDTSIPPPATHASQYYADFGPPVAFNQNEQLPPPPPYTVVPIPATATNAQQMKTSTDPSTVVSELVNQRFSPTTRQQLNSQQILRITQMIDKQEQVINDKMTVAVCISIISMTIGFVCIGLFVAYHNDLCDGVYLESNCARTYSALIVGCISILIGILRITIYCKAKSKISHAKRIWREKVAQIQQASVNGY